MSKRQRNRELRAVRQLESRMNWVDKNVRQAHRMMAMAKLPLSERLWPYRLYRNPWQWQVWWRL